MTESRQLCPRCGETLSPTERERASSRERPGICDACYLEGFDLVSAPETLRVRTCAGCGAVHRGNRWIDVGARDYTDVAVDEVTNALSVHVDAEDVAWGVEPEQVDVNTIRMHCTFTGTVRETPVEEHVTVPVSIARETCTQCGRKAGGYWASLIQVRADERTPDTDEIATARGIAESYIREREEAGDRNAFITETDETDDGLDVKISTTQMGRAISDRITRRLGGTIEDHATLVTEDSDGNEVYRVTYSVRLPRFRPGDVIDPDDGMGPVLVKSVRGAVKGTRVRTGDRYESAYEEGETPDARKLGSVDDAEETTLVAVEDENAIQVLDPETYASTTIPRPSYLDTGGETVFVIKSRAGLHALPRESVE
jgi:nonsense-mediated mRNA decay protein 3